MRTVGVGTPVRGAVGAGATWVDPVKDKDLTAPPGSPATDDRYIVAAGGTGLWSGHDTEIAEWDGAAWQFTTPVIALTTYVEDESEYYSWNGSAWVQESFGPHAATHTSGTDKLPATYSGDVLRRDASDWIATQINAESVDYLVGPVEQARFQTVQDAIDQAVTDGHGDGDPAIVFILDGTYTEDLSFKAGISLAAMNRYNSANVGPTPPSVNKVTITGNHTSSSNSGLIKFWGISFDGGSGSSIVTLSGSTGGTLITFYGCRLDGATSQSIITYGTGIPEQIHFYESRLEAVQAPIFTGGSSPLFVATNCNLIRSGDTGDVFDLGTGSALTIQSDRQAGVSGRIHAVSGTPILVLHGVLMTADAENIQIDTALNPSSRFYDCSTSGGEPLQITGAEADSFPEWPASAVEGDVWRYDGKQFVLSPGEVKNEISTTDATVTTIATIPIPDDTAVWIETNILARRTDVAGRGKWKRGALVYREGGGGATMEGGVWTPLTIKSAIPSVWDVDIIVSGNNALIQVTGAAAQSLDWTSRHIIEERS